MKFFAHLACGLVGLMWTTQAGAQLSTRGFALDRFEPAERGSEWFALDSVSQFGHLRPAFGLVLDYARKPLVLVDERDNEVAGIVDNQLYAHLGGSVMVWERLRLGLNLPILVANNGEGGTLAGANFSNSGGAGLGDARLAADYRFYGDSSTKARLNGGVRLHLPTGNPAAFSGDGAIRLTPQVAFAGDRDRVAYAARLGLGFRFRDQGFAGETFGAELQFGLAAGYRLLDNRALLLGPELLAQPSLSSDGDGTFGNTTPIELLFGAHYNATDQWRVGAGVGPGLASGFGSPSFRAVANIEWVAAADTDADRDGIENRADACPHLPGPPNTDPQLNGCPPIDSDADGVVDNADACPQLPGPPNDDPARNGCPATDSDADGVYDSHDACPREPGPANLDPTKNGCPMAKIAQGQIVIAEQVQFETGSAQIRGESDPLLQAVLKVLTDHPEIVKVSVEGHTDNRGPADLNRKLSQDRAASVVRWLAEHGVAETRLSSAGFGPDRPLADNETDAGRQKNRRVEFHIIPNEASTQP